MKLPLALATAATLIAFAVPALAGNDPPARGTPPSVEAQRGAWWLAFNDSTLNLLQVIARGMNEGAGAGSVLALEARVTSCYVQARVETLLLANAQAQQRGLQQQVAALPASGDPAAAERLRLQQRIAPAQSQADRAATRRSIALDALAQAVRGEAGRGALEAMLDAALSDARLPLPRVQVPDEVPAAWLQLRPDVEAAARANPLTASERHFVAYLQAISGSIAPATLKDRIVAGLLPARGDSVARARTDVALQLAHVQRRAQAAWAGRQRVQEAGARLQAIEARVAAGTGTLQEQLLAGDDLLAAEETLIDAAGALADAWIAFEVSVGGAT